MNWIILTLESLHFILVSFFLFTVPGSFLLGNKLKKEQFWKDFALSTVIGFALVSLTSYLLMIANLHLLIIVLIVAINLLYLKKIHVPKLAFKLNLTPIIFLIGVIGQMLIIAPSGLSINENLLFWSSHGHDGMWHLALVEEIQKGFPFQNPDLSQQRLLNYHYFSDISIADLNYFFKFSSLDLYFRFFPLIFSTLLGILSFQLGKMIGKTENAGRWSMFFTLFAGSFGYILTLIRDGTLGGESLFWSPQVQSSSGNPPQIIGLIFILAALVLINDYFQKPTLRLGGSLVLLVGTLAEFKIYGSIVLIAGLLVISFIYLFNSRNMFLLVISILGCLLTALLYLPNSAGSQTLLIFEPWWFIRTMIAAPDRLNWVDLELRRQTYLAHSNYLRVLQIEVESFLIFLIGNLGFRILGIWYLVKVSKQLFNDYLLQLILVMLLIALILPMLFIQKAVPANTIQFFPYFLLLFGILAGVSISEVLAKIKWPLIRVFFGLTIVLFAIPSQIGLLSVFYNHPAFAQISSAEITALTYLKNNSRSNDIVLTPPFQKGQKFTPPTPPIWLWSDTSYVPALSSRRVFIADIEQLDIMGYDYHPHQEIQKQIFETSNFNQFKKSIKDNNINFIYFPKRLRPQVDLTRTGVEKIYENPEVEIWKVN